uniref:Proton-coupled zinc antiporter SLC30A5 n=1 Tax=Elaeophora elaphi TaxID=1147741 RepID=A0A0R3S2D6_9BILA
MYCRSAFYFGLLVIVKFLRCIGIFIIDILSKQVHVVGLLWLFKLVASCILVPFQKPFNHGKSLKRLLGIRIAQLALWNCLIEVIWFYGITFCGPLRSILVFEQSPSVIMVALLTLLKGSNSSSKTRGVIALLLGYLSLVLMDSDATVEANHKSSHSHQSVLNHLFYHFIHNSGVSDHKGGIILLVFSVLIKMAYDSSFRHLAVEIGGPKRLYSLVTFFSAIFLAPVAIFAFAMGEAYVTSFVDFILLLFMGSMFVMVFDFYTESFCFQHVADPVLSSARWSPMIMFVCAFIFASVWYTGESYHAPNAHVISGGVLLTLFCFIVACFSLTSSTSPRSRGGYYVGLSDSGIPLYTYGEAFLQKTSRSIMLLMKETLAEILTSIDSRRIFWFLCANLSFCGIEFLYGFWTNSLGLISDGFHMLFDCSALVMGLVASVMSRWPSSKYYSYGYGRVEVLSGFINALFLIVIAFFIFLEALERLYDPPDISTDKLMIVAVAGLIINVFGMFAFHGATHAHSHGDDGSHSHNNASHSHSHSHPHSHSHGEANANMQGVFLHVLADTLGSVFVIISTLMIQYFGWKWVDPLCSLILSMLILGSVIPLLKQSMATLMQNMPPQTEEEFEHILHEILNIEGVISYSNVHLWQLKSVFNVASLHVQVSDDANDQIIRLKVLKILKSINITQASVQIEKENFFHRISVLCPSYKISQRITKGISIGHTFPSGRSLHNEECDRSHSTAQL